MARYRRGTDNARVYPVDQEYIPIGQDDRPVDQQTGATGPVKN
jgi:hypothetical protein